MTQHGVYGMVWDIYFAFGVLGLLWVYRAARRTPARVLQIIWIKSSDQSPGPCAKTNSQSVLITVSLRTQLPTQRALSTTGAISGWGLLPQSFASWALFRVGSTSLTYSQSIPWDQLRGRTAKLRVQISLFIQLGRALGMCAELPATVEARKLECGCPPTPKALIFIVFGVYCNDSRAKSRMDIGP